MPAKELENDIVIDLGGEAHISSQSNSMPKSLRRIKITHPLIINDQISGGKTSKDEIVPLAIDKFIIQRYTKYEKDGVDYVGRRYHCIDSQEDIVKLIKYDWNLCEVIDDEDPRWIYFDLEWVEEKLPDVFDKFVDWTFSYFKKELDIDLRKEDVVVSGTEYHPEKSFWGLDNPLKHSRHVVIQADKCFRNSKEQCAFMDMFIVNLPKKFYWEGLSIVDTSVYSRGFQSMKLINQSKYNLKKKNGFIKNSRQLPITHKDKWDKHFCRSNINNFFEIDVLKVVAKHKRQNRIKAKKGDARAIARSSGFPEFIIKENNIVQKEDEKYIHFLLRSIPNENLLQTYDTWMKIGFLLFNILPYSEAKEYHKEWSKDDYGFQSFWKSLLGKTKRSSNGFNLKHLENLAAKCNSNVNPKKQANKMISEYFNLDDPDITYEEYNEKWCRKIDTSKYKSHIIISPTGTGKSTCIHCYIDNLPNSTACYFSPRREFCRSKVPELNKKIKTGKRFRSYLDKSFHHSNDRVCISMESLHRLEHRNEGYNILVFDEIEALLTQLASKTMGKLVTESYRVLENLIKQADVLIFADAFISGRTISFIKNIVDKPTLLSKNLKLEVQRTKKELKGNFKSFCNKMLDTAISGKKFWCYAENAEGLEDFAVFLEQNKINYYIYTAAGKDRETLVDVNKSWQDVQVILYSPTITVGIDFSPKDDQGNDIIHFDCGFIYVSSNVGMIRNAFQGKARARHMNDNIIYYCVRDERAKQKKEESSFVFTNIKEATHFVKKNSEWIQQATENLDKKLRKEKNKDQCWEKYQKHCEKVAMIEFINETSEKPIQIPKYDFGLNKHWYKEPEWALINYAYNLLERSMGQNSTRILMDYYFDLTNHKEGEEEEPDELLMESEDIYKEMDFDSVKEASPEDKLSNTKYNRLRKSKGIFMSKVNVSSLKPNQRTALFKKFINESNMNLNSLFWNNNASRIGIQSTFEKEMERYGYGFLSSNLCLKFTLINKLVKRLGLKHSCDTSTIITQKTIDEKWKSIESIMPEINHFWKLNIPDKRRNDRIFILSEIFKGWNSYVLRDPRNQNSKVRKKNASFVLRFNIKDKSIAGLTPLWTGQ